MLSKQFYKIAFIFDFTWIFLKLIGTLCLNMGFMVLYFTFPLFFLQYFLRNVPERVGNRTLRMKLRMKLRMILSARSGKYYLIKPRY